MSKFNVVTRGTYGGRKTTNYEGAPAFLMDERTELYTRVLTSLMGENKFYESAAESDNRLVELIRSVAKTDPEFVAGLAIIARNKFYLRSVPQVVAVELADVHKGDNIVRTAIKAYMQRPDEMTELLAYFGTRFGDPQSVAKLRKIPNQIKKALADVFPKFDEYQLQKYNRKDEVKLRDVLFLVHPRPKDSKQAAVWQRLIDDVLKTPDTWETKLSVDGQEGKDKKDSWSEVVPNMGIMAILKNLRNLHENNVEHDLFLPKLRDERIISKSKLFPFRFMSAYRELQRAGAATEILDAVIDAMELSVSNLPKLPGRTLIAADCSASMGQNLSERGTVILRDISNLFASIVHKTYDNTMVGVFSTEWKVMGLSKRDSILTNKQMLDSRVRMGCTNTWKIFDWLTKSNEQFDRIIIMSDEQAWDSRGWGTDAQTVQQHYNNYCQKIGRPFPVYSIDLAGYGTSALDSQQPQVHKLAGWSEKVIEYIAACEADKKAVFDEIYAAIRSARLS